MKAGIVLYVMLINMFVYTQNVSINVILNNALRNESYLQRSNPTNTYKTSWHQLYRLKNNVLSIRFTQTNTLTNCACVVYKQVGINQVKSVAKDINVVFLTQPNAVKQLLTYQPCAANSNTTKIDTIYSDVFFTEVKSQKNNEELGEQLQRAFLKSNIQINIPYWYD